LVGLLKGGQGLLEAAEGLSPIVGVIVALEGLEEARAPANDETTLRRYYGFNAVLSLPFVTLDVAVELSAVLADQDVAPFGADNEAG
jgi:hypothetical protein